MDVEFLVELQQYVGFLPVHAAALAQLRPLVPPAFPGLVDNFYEAVARSPRAMAVFTGGAEQIARHKEILRGWLEGLFDGKYDADYLARRVRIGRSHVRIRLDQRYMLAAMNVVREGLHEAVSRLGSSVAHGHAAIDKICDLELAIILEAYAEDFTLRLRDEERLATLGQLAGFIAHELRNPLAAMETSLHLLRKRLPSGDEGALRHADRLGTQLAVSGAILTALLELSRDRPLERTSVVVQALVQAAVESLSSGGRPPLEVEIPGDLPEARVDVTQVRQALANLLVNAQQAVAGRPNPRIACAAEREADTLVLSVDDSGPGVPEALQARLFEPLGAGRAHGPGLGLALCRRIAEKHGGELRALRGALGGARFELRLPAAYPP